MATSVQASFSEKGVFLSLSETEREEEFMTKLMYLWFAVKTVFCTCQPDHKENGFQKVRSQYKITKIGKLPTVADESSGLARKSGSNTFWTHNDSGGKAELYELNGDGELVSIRPVTNATNIDWEDLADDEQGNIYIGDFGNNNNNRKNLLIYKLSQQGGEMSKISFKYTSQTQFPPPAGQWIYDSEAFFHDGQNLYLFSKNQHSAHKTLLYKIPDQPGDYTISPIDSIQITSPVTSADISPDGQTFALLTYGKVLLFAIENGQINFTKPIGCFRTVKKQAEAILFINNTDMILTNEQEQLYRITRR